MWGGGFWYAGYWHPQYWHGTGEAVDVGPAIRVRKTLAETGTRVMSRQEHVRRP